MQSFMLLAMRAQKVLLVDADDWAVNTVSRVLRNAGYAVIQAGSCAAARSLSVRFDIGIFELELSDGDGCLLAGELLADGCVCRAVFFTDSSVAELLREAARIGRIVSKGAAPSVLVDAVFGSRRPVTHVPPSQGSQVPDSKSKLG